MGGFELERGYSALKKAFWDAKKAAAFKKAMEGRLELEVWMGAEAGADALQACKVA